MASAAQNASASVMMASPARCSASQERCAASVMTDRNHSEIGGVIERDVAADLTDNEPGKI